MDNSLSFYSCNWESLRQPHFPQILESALAVNCEVISQNERAVGGCPPCMLSLTPAGWGAAILLIRALLTHYPFQGCVQCSWGLVPVQRSLWEGSTASPPPKTDLFYQLFRTKAFRRSMLQIHKLLGDIWCLQYLITCLDNLSDSSLIPLALEFPPKIAQGLYLSVFYFLAQEIMKLTRVMLE